MAARTVVVCPDSFKGSVDAATAADAIRRAWLRARPQDRVVALPMADGGEGTVDAFRATDAAAVTVPVIATAPDGTPRATHWLRAGDTAVVELALTSGLSLPRPADGLDARSDGFGEAVAAAVEAGCRRVLLALGGSATSDAGAGALTALGARLLDAAGAPIGPGNRGLAGLHAVDLAGLRPLPPDGVEVLADVRSPMLGPAGAVRTFGAQKGIAREDVALAERNLERFAALVGAATGADPATPGAGAAGGTGFAMLAWGATIVSGARTVARRIGLDTAIDGADVVVTGEGRFDAQSEQGKVAVVVRELAASRSATALLVAGSIDGDTAGFADAVSLAERAGGVAAALSEPERWIEEATLVLARRFDARTESS